MSSAKEGGRTPTRVTSLEPEGTARERFAERAREVRSKKGANVVTHETAGYRTTPRNTGACTGSRIDTFHLVPGAHVVITGGSASGSSGTLTQLSRYTFGSQPVWEIDLGSRDGYRATAFIRADFLRVVS
jgi:hypothetical protein